MMTSGFRPSLRPVLRSRFTLETALSLLVLVAGLIAAALLMLMLMLSGALAPNMP